MPEEEGATVGGSGFLLGTNALQQAIEGLETIVGKLTSAISKLLPGVGNIVQGANQNRSWYGPNGSSSGSGWNASSNWMNIPNGGVSPQQAFSYYYNTFGAGAAANNYQGQHVATPNGGAHLPPTQPPSTGQKILGGGATFGAAAITLAGSLNRAFGVSPQNSYNDSMNMTTAARLYNFGQNPNYTGLYNDTNWAMSGADRAQTIALLSSQSGYVQSSPQYNKFMSQVTSTSLINPTISGAQSVQGAMGLYSPGTFTMLRGIGINTYEKGQKLSPTQIANQILNQIDPSHTVKTVAQATALAYDPMSPLAMTLSNWLKNGVITSADVQTIQTQVYGLLLARIHGMSANQLNKNLTTASNPSASESAREKAQAALKGIGLENTTLQSEKDKATTKENAVVQRLGGFEEGLKAANGALSDFHNALNWVTRHIPGFNQAVGAGHGALSGLGGAVPWITGGIGALAGGALGAFTMTPFGVGAGAAGGFALGKGLGDLLQHFFGGGDNESRMSVIAQRGYGAGIPITQRRGSGGSNDMRMSVTAAGNGGFGMSMGGAQSTNSASTGGRGNGTGGTLIWPVNAPLGLGFGVAGPMWASGYHTGQDFECPTGTPVKAAAAGVVNLAGWNGPYGICVIINHGNGVQTLYAHNERTTVHVGQRVNQGQIISYSDSTGNVTGPHLHFEVRINGKPVNPLPYLQGRPLNIAPQNAGAGSGSGSGSNAGQSPYGNGSGTSYVSSQSGNIDEAAVLASALSGGSGMTDNAPAGWWPGGVVGGTSGGTSGGGNPSMGGISGGGTASQNIKLGQQMASRYGWGTGMEWQDLYQLWMRESGWNTRAKNPSSGAYGIPQSLPASKMGTIASDYLTDPKTQIEWGLQYIKKTYGDPERAWAHEESAGWYDKGAWDLPKDERAVVHKGEMIIPANQARQIREVLLQNSGYKETPGIQPTAPGAQVAGAGCSLVFNQGSIVIYMNGSGDVSEDGYAMARQMVDALAQDQRISALMTGQPTRRSALLSR